MTTDPVIDIEHHYDHVDISKLPNPFPLFEQVRARCPVVHTDRHDGFWVLLRHHDVAEAASNPAVFSSSKNVTIPSHAFPMPLPPIEIDPPQHRQFRAPLVDRFSPTAVAMMEDELRTAVRQLIAAFIEDGTADLAQQLTMQLPAVAVSYLLAIPDEDRDLVRSWAVRLIHDPEDMDAVGDAMEYFAQIYDARRLDPADDIPSLMLQIEVDGRPILEEEFLLMMSTLVMAGLDTTANAGAHMLQVLSARPELRDELLENRALLPSAVEELLRYITPLPALGRTVTEPVEIGGCPIAAGDRVHLNWLSANHDPEVFQDPETIRLDRPNNRHLSFGAGPHRCLGAHLARLELRILLEEVLDTIPDFKVDEASIIRTSGITRGILELPATFTPRSAAPPWARS